MKHQYRDYDTNRTQRSCNFMASIKAQHVKARVRGQQRSRPPHPPVACGHLELERPPLDLRDALGDDEGDAVAGTAGHLGEVLAEQLQAAVELLGAALDGQGLQATLVARQEALGGGGRRRPSTGRTI